MFVKCTIRRCLMYDTPEILGSPTRMRANETELPNYLHVNVNYNDSPLVLGHEERAQEYLDAVQDHEIYDLKVEELLDKNNEDIDGLGKLPPAFDIPALQADSIQHLTKN